MTFKAAVAGYYLYELSEFKSAAETFAKAAEKFGKLMGKQITASGHPDFWKQIYENFDLWFMTQGAERIFQICLG